MSSDHAGTPPGQKLCFVVMGFGKKTDFETGRTLDLDKTYKYIIKPVAEEAGLVCVRADEIVHSGLIDVPMYEQLLKADVVVADLSTSSKNAFYELGVRHALRPFTTIIIAEDGIRQPLPFDVNHVPIRMYHHLGDSIGFDEVMRFRGVLREALDHALERPQVDSPVYTFLEGLKSDLPGERLLSTTGPSAPAAADHPGEPPPAAVPAAATPPPEPSPQQKKLTDLVERLGQAVKGGRFAEAGQLFSAALEVVREGVDDGTAKSYTGLVERLVRAALQVRGAGRAEVLSEARILLLNAGAEDSNDPETLELLGDIEFALFNESRQVNPLQRARQTYKRLHAIRGNYRSGIALATITSLHAEFQKIYAEKISDIVEANRLRREVVEAAKTKLAKIAERYRTEARLSSQGAQATLRAAEAREKLDVWAAMAEAYYGLGEKDSYAGALDEARRLQGADKMVQALESRMKQFEFFWEAQAALLSSLSNSVQPLPQQPPAVNMPATPSIAEPRPGATEEAEPPAPKDEPRVERDLIFFSYSHNDRDKKILDEIQKTLAPLFQDQPIQMWDDGHIAPGQDWEQEIKQALARAMGAVLIVSRDFLTSQFISKEELPVILQGVEEEGVKLMWVATEKAFVPPKIRKYQALRNPEKPLDYFTGRALNDEIFEICEEIRKKIFPDAS